MDCQMPIMDGYEATSKIRELTKNHERIRIVAVSGHADQQHVKDAMKAGFDEVYGKPFENSILKKELKLAKIITK